MLLFFLRTRIPPISTRTVTLLPDTPPVHSPAPYPPGAIDAVVPRAIDAMLRDWASEKTRGDFVATLDALDAAARSATGKGLAALLPDRRAPVVAAFDADRIAALHKTVRASCRESVGQYV